MNIHEVVKGFQALGYVTLGAGPKHPKGNPKTQLEIDAFLKQYPTIAQDQGFVEFLEYYSAAAVDWPNEQLTIEVYGFSPDITLEIARPEEPLEDHNGFFRFAEILITPGPDGEQSIASTYAMDVTGTRAAGIYHKLSVWSEDSRMMDYGWHCDNFLVWLSRVVRAGGRLPMVDYRK